MKSTHHLISVFLFLFVACHVTALPEHPRLLVTEADKGGRILIEAIFRADS